jgi:hypothetical protein
MDIRTSKVEASAVLGESGKRIGPGQFVDLDEPFANGTLRDVFTEEMFEPVVVQPDLAQQTDAPAEEPVASRRVKKEKS